MPITHRSNDKLTAAVHFLIARIPPDDLGATKLNKILWAADCEYYSRHGRSLTGETEYIRKDYGPCPQSIESVLSRLKDDGAVAERRQQIVHFTQREFTPLTEPDIEQFTKEEIDILLSIALEIAPLTAKRASEDSHNDLWRGTDSNGRMSVAAGSIRILPPTPELFDWARQAFSSE